MANKTMPPSDPTPSMPPDSVPAPSGMPPGGMPPAGGQGVMISMPKAVFDELHMIVMQLAQGVHALAQKVEAESGGGAMVEPPADQARGEDMTAEGEPTDEDFLNEMAAQGTK